MQLAVTRSHEFDPGGWLRQPSQTFVLTTVARFSNEEVWVINTHSLYHHIIVDRTPVWFPGMLRETLRRQEQAERAGQPFEWPHWLPASIPEEWVLSAGRLLVDPLYVVTFRTAHELAEFEPRLCAAFLSFKRFLEGYGSRPATLQWRL